MRKSIKSFASLGMAISMLLGMSTLSLAADSSVSYEGGAEKYVFLPGSDYTDSDLFDNFKGVMPGDVLEQKIIVTNKTDDCDYVKIYMRAVAHDEVKNPLSETVADATDIVSMQDFLSQLSMKIWNGSELIYEATPDELDGLAENVLLGSFELGESTELTVELTVPIELGNEYANRVGEVDWVFVAEELNHPTPETGDHSNVMIYIVMMAIALTAVVVILKKRTNK